MHRERRRTMGTDPDLRLDARPSGGPSSLSSSGRFGAARKFTLPDTENGQLREAWRMLAVILGVVLLTLYGIHVDHRASAALLVFGVMMLAGSALVPRRSRSSVVVGVDGVLAPGRFVHHADIASVEHVRRHYEGGEPTYNWDFPLETTLPSDTWVVSLRLVGGEVMCVRSAKDPPAGDPDGNDLSRTIRDAHAAWHGSHHEVDAISRGERTGAQWRDALRRLGAGTTTAYRSVTMDAEALGRVLDDNRARPSTRAAAAVALAASGDATLLRDCGSPLAPWPTPRCGSPSSMSPMRGMTPPSPRRWRRSTEPRQDSGQGPARARRGCREPRRPQPGAGAR